MYKDTVWRKFFIFNKKFKISMPFEYDRKALFERQCIFRTEGDKGIFINAIDEVVNDGNKFLFTIYSKLGNAEKNISEPFFAKRDFVNMRQSMMRFSCGTQNAILVIVCASKNSYIIEFTYSGVDVNNWIKECEYILNTIRITNEEEANGD